MIKIRVKTILYESLAGEKFTDGQIAELPEEEARRAVLANVGEFVEGSPPPKQVPPDDDDFTGEPSQPQKKPAKR